MAMEFDPAAYDAKTALDAVNPRMADRVDEWLDQLEADHTQAIVRRHRLHQPALWMILVKASDGDDYAILWDLDDDTVAIRYIGPDVFH
jgi:hypothetical protein